MEKKTKVPIFGGFSMILAKCDRCGTEISFENMTEQINSGWKIINHIVTCVACRLQQLEDANCGKEEVEE